MYYANDICLIAPTATAMQCMLDICYNYSLDNDVLFNCNRYACYLTLSDPGYFVSPACRGWYKKAHPYYFNN